jgi:hypothetical protein
MAFRFTSLRLGTEDAGYLRLIRKVPPELAASRAPQLHAICSLADSAAMIYLGVLPMDSPYLFWNEGRWLPWCKERTAGPPPFPMREVSRLAAEIVAHFNQSKNSLDEPVVGAMHLYMSPTLCRDVEATAKSMSVLIMIQCDKAAAALLEPADLNLYPPMRVAYEAMCEILVRVLPMTEAGESARRAASARHANARQKKEVARAFYLKNRIGHTSDELALRMFNEKVVPQALRTIQDWITQFRKEAKLKPKPKAKPR